MTIKPKTERPGRTIPIYLPSDLLTALKSMPHPSRYVQGLIRADLNMPEPRIKASEFWAEVKTDPPRKRERRI